jgi:hypothetical protein
LENRHRGENPHVPAVDLVVFRVEKGETHRVRTLAGTGTRAEQRQLLGYMTHWRHGATRVCVGPHDCEPALHRIDAIWYGYLAVERWDEEMHLWVPHVLQVTESLELDMRKKLARGQYWELSMVATRAKGNPTRGQLIGLVQDELPMPFDVLPVLRTMFHRADLQPPSIANPAPGRIALVPSTGAPPPGSQVAERQEQFRVPVDSEGVRPRWQEVKKRVEDKKHETNGKH